jgi:Flp pilus assembly pilin Flp
LRYAASASVNYGLIAALIAAVIVATVTSLRSIIVTVALVS